MSRAITDCGCPYDDRLRQGHRDSCPTLVALTWPDGTPKIAPVQGYEAGIPWSIQLEAYDAYKKRWSSQAALIDLDRRGCRGGFGTRELDEFVPDWRERASEIAHLKRALGLFMAAKQGIAADSYDGIEPRYRLLMEEAAGLAMALGIKADLPGALRTVAT